VSLTPSVPHPVPVFLDPHFLGLYGAAPTHGSRGQEEEAGAKGVSKLEELSPNAAVRGILPEALVTVLNVQWFGSDALELTYKTPPAKWRTGTQSPACSPRCSPFAAMLEALGPGPALPPGQVWYVAEQGRSRAPVARDEPALLRTGL